MNERRERSSNRRRAVKNGKEGMANAETAIEEESALNGLALEGALSPLRWQRGEMRSCKPDDDSSRYGPSELAALDEATIKWRIAPLCDLGCGCDGDVTFVIEEANALGVPRVAAMVVEDEEGFANLGYRALVRTVFRCGPAPWGTWVEERDRVQEDVDKFVEPYYAISGFVVFSRDRWITEMAANAALTLIREMPDLVSSNFRLTKERGEILHKIVSSRVKKSMDALKLA